MIYHASSALLEDLSELETYGYKVDGFNAKNWEGSSDFHDAIHGLNNPRRYSGQNLDAFADWIEDLAVPSQGGRIFSFQNFDKFARRNPKFAQEALDCLAKASWKHLLMGRRFMTFIQLVDPSVRFSPVGAHPITLNFKEMFQNRKNRPC